MDSFVDELGDTHLDTPKDEANVSLQLANVYTAMSGETDGGGKKTFLCETFNMALLDTGCTQSVCGEEWLSIYLKSLDKESRVGLKMDQSLRSFKFGDGKVVPSKGKIKLPIYLSGVKKNICVLTNIVNENIPLLLGKPSLKKAGAVLKYNNDDDVEEVHLFGEKQPVFLTSNGHTCIPLTKYFIRDEETHGTTDDQCHIMFTGTLNNLSTKQKKKIAKKLHEQFAHASSSRITNLLKDGNVDDKELFDLVSDSEKVCTVCQKYKKASLRPVVCFPRSREFNESLAIDLKFYLPSYLLHIIDHFTRFSRAVVIKDKNAETVVKGVLRAWIALFGAPKQILSDNGGEFSNENFAEMCEKFNVTVKTTAAESPWSNGVNERHNALLHSMIEKLLDDGHSLEDAACWSTSAKNALANNKGYSPNQLAFGFNPNIPNVLGNELPAMEPCRFQDVLCKTLSAMQEARKSFIQLEADERLQRAIKKKVRTNISSIHYQVGEEVYFKRGTHWRGPGKIIGIDDKMLLIKQGGQFYRVPPCSCKHINEEEKEEVSVPVSDKSAIVGKKSNELDSRAKHYDDIELSSSDDEQNENEVVQENNAVDEVHTHMNQPSTIINLDDAIRDEETQLNERIVDKEECTRFKEFNASQTPDIKSLVECKFDDDQEWQKLRIVKRGGKVGGKHEKWFNVYDANNDDPKIFSVDWDRVVRWKQVPEEVLLSTRSNSEDPAIIEAKMTELDLWKKHKVYEEVENKHQDCISVQWVITQKYIDAKRVVKARLVARGFLESSENIKKDSPTASKESIRLLLTMAVSYGWSLGSLDVKSAFLQGDNINRLVILKPPKEASTEKLWRLNRCVYGLVDASRRWYLRIDSVLTSLGMNKMKLDEAVYSFTYDGRLCGLLCLHVDDFIWCGDSFFKKEIIDKFTKIFNVSRNITGTFIHLGLQIRQLSRCIIVEQQHYVDAMNEPEIDTKNRKRDEELSEEEKKENETICWSVGMGSKLHTPRFGL